jgi:hypothetical protein
MTERKERRREERLFGPLRLETIHANCTLSRKSASVSTTHRAPGHTQLYSRAETQTELARPGQKTHRVFTFGPGLRPDLTRRQEIILDTTMPTGLERC